MCICLYPVLVIIPWVVCPYSVIDDPPIGGVPLSAEIIGSLIQPGMGAMYDYYYKRPNQPEGFY